MEQQISSAYMVQKLLNLDHKPKPDDAADGLAIAICHMNCEYRRLGGRVIF